VAEHHPGPEVWFKWRGSAQDLATDITCELTPVQVLEICKQLVEKIGLGMDSTKTERQLGEWVVSTCLLFGTSATTAYKIAGVFLEALRELG
jgi:hypothetical protein